MRRLSRGGEMGIVITFFFATRQLTLCRRIKNYDWVSLFCKNNDQGSLFYEVSIFREGRFTSPERVKIYN